MRRRRSFDWTRNNTIRRCGGPRSFDGYYSSKLMPPIGNKSDDHDWWRPFRTLFYGKRSPRNGSQESLLLAWDALDLVHTSGFEAIIDQSVPLEQYVAALEEVGLMGAASVVTRVRNLLSSVPREEEEAFWAVVGEQFEILKCIAEEFWDKSSGSDLVLQRFVSDRLRDFAEYLPGTATRA